MTLRLMGEEVTVVDAKARAELGYVAAVSPVAGLAEMRQARARTISESVMSSPVAICRQPTVTP